MKMLIGRLTRMKVVGNRFKTSSWQHSFKDFSFFVIYGYYYHFNVDCEEGGKRFILDFGRQAAKICFQISFKSLL